MICFSICEEEKSSFKSSDEELCSSPSDPDVLIKIVAEFFQPKIVGPYIVNVLAKINDANESKFYFVSIFKI